MQEKFLELRCILANKEAVMESEQTQGWLDIMRVVQIYDDLQDVVEDDGYQDNLVISVAYHKFKEEWSWLKANRPLLQNSKQRHFLLSVFMPQTVSYCLKIAAARMGSMNWEQQKIIHYILFKNWFVAEPFEGVEGFEHWQGEVNFLLRLYQQLQFLMPDSDKLHIKAHLIHSCFHMDPIKRMLRKKLNLTNYYQLRYNLLMVSPQIKSKAFDRITGIAAS